MRYVADITLIENSSDSNPPKAFTLQTIEIRKEQDTISMSADGVPGTAKHPATVRWNGGSAADFEHTTHVCIVAADGTILIRGEVLRIFELPHDIAGGVQFQVI